MTSRLRCRWRTTETLMSNKRRTPSVTPLWRRTFPGVVSTATPTWRHQQYSHFHHQSGRWRPRSHHRHLWWRHSLRSRWLVAGSHVTWILPRCWPMYTVHSRRHHAERARWLVPVWWRHGHLPGSAQNRHSNLLSRTGACRLRCPILPRSDAGRAECWPNDHVPNRADVDDCGKYLSITFHPTAILCITYVRCAPPHCLGGRPCVNLPFPKYPNQIWQLYRAVWTLRKQHVDGQANRLGANTSPSSVTGNSQWC